MSQSESVSQQPKKASLFQIAKAVAWSLLGVRKMQSYESDIASIKPVSFAYFRWIGSAVCGV